MDGHNIDALFFRGRTQDKNPGKPSGGGVGGDLNR
jgi:hypothetical protein